jgi:hypothetical protein
VNNFNINFTHAWQPWLFFLIIPAVALALFPYFRLKKKHRRTLNRILSLVAHITVAVLCVTVLTGMTFVREMPEPRRDTILLIDVSDSMNFGSEIESDMNVFIEGVFATRGNNRLDVVLFANGSLHLSRINSFEAFRQYMTNPTSERPVGNASNIEEALLFARDRFSNPQTGRIVLLSDGLQTDGEVFNAVRVVANSGVRVDVKHFGRPELMGEVQILSVHIPSSFSRGEDMPIRLGVQSSEDLNGQPVTIQLFSRVVGEGGALPPFLLPDGITPNPALGDPVIRTGILTGNVQVPTVVGGVVSGGLLFNYRPPAGTIHELMFRLQIGTDTVPQNNLYFSFFSNTDRSLLILTRPGATANGLFGIAENEFQRREVRSVLEAPTSANEFSEYNQVIMMNLSNADVQRVPGLDRNLHDYVHELGGSLLFAGGPNAFLEEDMTDTLLEEMLPIFAETQRAPVAILLVLDISSSMTDPRNSIGGRTRLQIAQEGLRDALDLFGENDWVGLVTFGGGSWTEWPIMPAGERHLRFPRTNPRTGVDENLNMYEIVDGLDVMRGTWYDAATSRAVSTFASFPHAGMRRHMIFITDGAPTAGQDEGFLHDIRALRSSGVTTSSIAISLDADDSHGGPEASRANIEAIAAYGGGRAHILETNAQMWAFPEVMQGEMLVALTPDFEEITFNPRMLQTATYGTIGAGVQFHGYNGARAKPEVLASDWVLSKGYEGLDARPDDPIYVVWRFGLGRVGAFMTDLGDGANSWGRELFYNDVGAPNINGRNFLLRVMQTLAPTSSEGNTFVDRNADFTRDNMTRHLRYTVNDPQPTLDRFAVRVYSPNGNVQEFLNLTLVTGQSFFSVSFETPEVGIYNIEIRRTRGAGGFALHGQTDPIRLKTAFSYSDEHNAFPTSTLNQDETLMARVAEGGDGRMLDQPFRIFDIEIETRVWNPRILFLSLAMGLMLFDIVCRKFKFKRDPGYLQAKAQARASKSGVYKA